MIIKKIIKYFFTNPFKIIIINLLLKQKKKYFVLFLIFIVSF